MNYKYVITRLIYKLRYKLNHRLPMNKIIQSTTTPKVYLFGAIEHMNYGDQAINIAENKLLREQGYEYISIPESFIDDAISVVKSHIQPTDVIFCHGGGNMGDVWPEQEKWRHDIFNAFPNNKIIVFPQSVNFKPDSELLRQAIQATSKHQNLTFLMRDQYSYDFVKEHFPKNIKVKLVPDIVMTLEKANSNIKREDVVTTFLRRDVEKLADSRIDKLVATLANKYHVESKDTVSDYWYYVDDRNRDAFLDKKLREFQTSKLIVTDRLHGMIFAAITKTPAIVFDNNNHKIFNLYNTWLKDCQYLEFINRQMNNQDIEVALLKVLANTNYNFDQENFKQIILAAIKEG